MGVPKTAMHEQGPAPGLVGEIGSPWELACVPAKAHADPLQLSLHHRFGDRVPRPNPGHYF
jgi:hypothetical protein